MKKSALLVILGVIAAADRAAAQGFIIPEMGTRVNGMGAAIGRPDDLSAIYHNPAALAQLPGTQIMVGAGLSLLTFDVRLRPWAGSEPYLTDPLDAEGYFARQSQTVVAPMPVVGISTNLFSDKVVGALGVYVPNAAGASFGESAPSRYHIIDAHVVSAFFTGAVGYRPWSWLAIGAGVSAVYIDIYRRSLLFPVIDGRPLESILGANTELLIEGSDVKPAFSAGIQVWPHRTVSLGAMMLSRYDVALEGPLRLKLGEGALSTMNKPEFTENEHRTTVVSPWIIGFGANWDVTRWLELGYEFRLYLNSAVKEQVTTITKGTLLRAFLPKGFVTPKNLQNSYHTGGGVLIKPPLGRLALEFLTGAHFDNAASPDNTVEVSAPSFNLLSWHNGVRWRINDTFRVAAFYSHYWYFERTITDSITSPPTNFKGSGYNNMLALVLEARLAAGLGVRPARAD